MKQTFTLENELTMYVELLSEMVRKRIIKKQEMERYLELFLKNPNDQAFNQEPGTRTINNLLNYSKSLEVLKPVGEKPHLLVLN
jgi:hypothetical protein